MRVSAFKKSPVSGTPSERKGQLSEETVSWGGSRDSATFSRASSLSFNQMWQMYLFNVWINACVERITAKVADITPIVRSYRKKEKPEKLTREQRKQKDKIEELFNNPNDGDDSWFDLTEMRMRDLLTYASHGLEVIKDQVTGLPIALYPVTGKEVKPLVNKKGNFKDVNKAYAQVQSGQTVATWAQSDFIWLRNRRIAGRPLPVSPLETLQQTVTAELYASQFNLDFFANNATPRLAVMFDNLGIGQATPTLKRMRQWWDSELRGQPHRPILLGTENGSVKIEEVGKSNRDMEFQFYSGWLLMKIMAVYKMQPFVLGVVLDSQQGKLNSAQQVQLFKTDAMKPQLELFSDNFNNKVIWRGFGYDSLYMDYSNFDTWDKQEKAILHERYLRNGVYTINMVLDELGMEPVPWGDTPLIASNLQTMENALQVNDSGGENTKPDTPENDTPNAKVPGSDSSGADTEAEAQSGAKKSIMLSQRFLKGCGIEEGEIGRALSSISNRRDAGVNKLYSFPNVG